MITPIPILLSEKVILASQAYSLAGDPFVGLIKAHLSPNIQIHRLNFAFQKSLRSHSSFRISFKKQDQAFKKEIGPPVGLDIKVFNNKPSFLLWKTSPLPLDFLYELGLYKTLFQKTLLFKFHHLIMDGISCAYFFQDLTKNYLEPSSSVAPHPEKQLSERKIYQKVLQDLSNQEKQNRNKKQAFWKQQLQDFKSHIKAKSSQEKLQFIPSSQHAITQPEPANTSQMDKEITNFLCVSLSRSSLKKLLKLQLSKQSTQSTPIKMPYLLFSIYSKALQESLAIDAMILRTAFSGRHNLKTAKEKQILASLSRSVPLFIPDRSLSLLEQALEFQKQAKKAREFLVMDKFPIYSNELKSYSKVKNQYLSLSMSYVYYQEKQFLGPIKSFSWQGFIQDIVLFMILSEKKLLLNFTYNPRKFSKKEIKNLYRHFVRQIRLKKV